MSRFEWEPEDVNYVAPERVRFELDPSGEDGESLIYLDDCFWGRLTWATGVDAGWYMGMLRIADLETDPVQAQVIARRMILAPRS